MATATTKPKSGSGRGRGPGLLEKNLQMLGVKYRMLTPREKEILAEYEARKKGYRGITQNIIKTGKRRYQQDISGNRVSRRVKTKSTKRRPRGTPKHIKYPRWWRDIRVTGINISGDGEFTIVKGKAGERSFINSIVFTVSDETRVRLNFGSYGSSGFMNFGGNDEPRGISMNFGDAPAPCGTGGFSIFNEDAGASIGGFVIYFQEPDEPPEELEKR